MSKDLLTRLRNTTKKVAGQVMSEADFFDKYEMVSTPVPIINFALSGFFAGGLGPEVFEIAAKSKHFKTLYGLMMMSAFLKKYPDGVAVFYDSEFGARPEYFENSGIDTSRVIWKPVNIVQEWVHDCVSLIDSVNEGEHVFIFVDSIGNMASAKETVDALTGKDVQDMTRAKAFKSAFRMIPMRAMLKGIPVVVINHTYDDQTGTGKQKASGGTGVEYNSNNIWQISRVQDKDEKTKVIEGYNFKIKIEKSRTIREGKSFDVDVSFDTGINRWSGLLDIALETGHVTIPSQGWYSRTNVPDDKKWRRAETNSIEFWRPLLTDPTFEAKAREIYCIVNKLIVGDGDQKVETTDG